MVSDMNADNLRPTAEQRRPDLLMRLAGPSSVEDLAKLWVDAESSRRASESPSSTPAHALDLRVISRRLTALIGHTGTIPLIARLGDQPAAMTVVVQGRADDGASDDPEPGLAHVTMVAVRPDLWGHRYGEGVLRHAVERAARQGYRRAQLWTPASNRRARSLYERIGWTLSGRERQTEDGELLIHYELDLTE
jgi:ribosomal protein S18 acetylase RimI-like enzyme